MKLNRPKKSSGGCRKCGKNKRTGTGIVKNPNWNKGGRSHITRRNSK